MQVWVVGLYGIVPVGVELDRLLTPELLQRHLGLLQRQCRIEWPPLVDGKLPSDRSSEFDDHVGQRWQKCLGGRG